MKMASITITINESGTTYQRVGGGYTGEVYEAPRRIHLPAPVAEAMGLSPWSFDGEGNCVEYTLLYPLMDERIVHAAKAEQETQCATPANVHAKDNSYAPEGFNWKLEVRPEAVRQGGCKLRGEGKNTYIEQPEPATTKAAYRENEHRTATMVVYRAEARKRRVA